MILLRIFVFVALGIISLGNICQAQVVPSTVLKTYTNPVLNQDFADPTVIKAADGFYYGYATNTLRNGISIHIQVAKSADLVNWEMLSDAMPQKPAWADKDFWAPHVSYDTKNKTYYLYYSGESNNSTGGKCLGVATSKDPAGPFIDKGTPLLCGESFVNIDPMQFDDPVTGKKLLYWGSAFKPLKVQELADDHISFKAGSVSIDLISVISKANYANNYFSLLEGSWMVYHKGYYFLMFSGNNCCGANAHYAVMVARSKSATGPFETMAQATNEKSVTILEQNERWKAPGHNSVVKDDSGQDWICYHAVDTRRTGFKRVMLIDKIEYKNGWPIISSNTPSVGPTRAPVVKIKK